MYITDLLKQVEDGALLNSMQLGALVDAFKEAEQERLAADKVAAAKKTVETQLKLAILQQLGLHETSVAGGKVFKVERTIDQQPSVSDWPKLYAHILETQNWDLLERRVGKAAVKLRWEDGKEVPGVDSFPVEKLFFTKLKG